MIPSVDAVMVRLYDLVADGWTVTLAATAQDDLTVSVTATPPFPEAEPVRVDIRVVAGVWVVFGAWRELLGGSLLLNALLDLTGAIEERYPRTAEDAE